MADERPQRVQRKRTKLSKQETVVLNPWLLQQLIADAIVCACAVKIYVPLTRRNMKATSAARRIVTRLGKGLGLRG